MENNNKRGFGRTRAGIVIRDNMHNTISVKVDRIVAHKKYRKSIKLSSKYQVHDTTNETKVGDKVSIVECRPYSKTKRWRLKEVLNRVES